MSKSKKIGSWLMSGTILIAFFIVVGNLVPAIFDRSLPFDFYVDIQDVVVEDVDTAEAFQSATVVYDARQDINASANVSLVLVNAATNQRRQVARLEDLVTFEEEETSLILDQQLPPNVEDGSYYWLYGFELNINGNIKTLIVRSNTFNANTDS